MLNIFSRVKPYLFFLVFSIFLLSPFFANAQGFQPVSPNQKNNNGIAITLCKGVKILGGTPVKIIASIMVMAVGAGFLLGKIDIKVMIGVALAIATIFGAPSIYQAITGTSDSTCETTNQS
jgi:type IV secretory pathway VirB2 component (pilin)